MPRVLAYLAVSAFLGDFDGYRHGHNYRLYRDPSRDKWMLLPWGLDRAFKKKLGVYDSGGLLARRCFADGPCRREYVRVLHEVVRTYEALDLPGELERTAAFIDGALRNDPRRPYGVKDIEQRRKQLRRFLDRRPAAVRKQIECLDDTGEHDRDGDGFGCLDADDADPAVRPGAIEACDGKDNDGNGLVDDGAACACPTVVAGGVTFHLCELPMTWTEAAAFCAVQGHALARFDDAEQSRIVAEAAREQAKGKWWIGLSDRDGEGEFRWDDGAPLDFTRWAKGEPDNGECNQDCAVLGQRGTGDWHDTHCASRLPFVCSASR